MTAGGNDLKIADFGLSRYIESGNQLSCLEGRLEYMSPEVIALQPLTTAADSWSLGTIIYLMYVLIIVMVAMVTYMCSNPIG